MARGAVEPPEVAGDSGVRAPRERMFESLFEHAFDAIFVIDDEGRVVDANARASEIFRASHEELLACNIRDLTPSESLPLLEVIWPRFLEAAHARGEAVYRRVDDSTFTGEFTARARFVPGRNLVIIRDISDRKRIEAALAAEQREVERLREEWTSIIAHDLRQPVASIMTCVALLERHLRDPEAGQRAARIRENARRLDRMIDDLLDGSRLAARRLSLIRSPTDLPALVRTIVAEATCDGEGPPVVVTIVGAIPPLIVDGQRIEQVFTNLLTNAWKYGDGAPVEVTVERRTDEVWVAVKNRGPGIASEDIPQLFERFERGRRRKGAGGLGLGLYIARGLVEAHGGRIWVESVPGETTTFCFSLPLDPPA